MVGFCHGGNVLGNHDDDDDDDGDEYLMIMEGECEREHYEAQMTKLHQDIMTC